MPYYSRLDSRNWSENAAALTERGPSSPSGTEEKKDKDYFFEGHNTFVRIPELPGHICRKHDPESNVTSIQLITETHYDPESKQMRNTKVTIGTDVSCFYPGMMLIKDAFFDYFDLHGKIFNTAFRKQLEEEARKKEEKKTRKTERILQAGETETAATEQAEEQAERQAEEQTENLPEGDTRTVDEIRESLLLKEKQLEEERKALEAERRELEKAREEVENIREEKLLTLAEKEKAHATLLSEILDSHQHTVMEQAKRRPDKFMKQTQIRHINEILQEIREMLAGSNAFRYLHLAEEPREDDLEHYPGTTYGEMDILLNAYGWAMSARRYNRLYWEAEEDSKEEKDEE